MKKFVSGVVYRITGLLMLFASVTPAQNALTGQQILDQVKASYAQCQSYMDTGQVTTVFITERERRTVIKPFMTAFVRPDSFRFEYQARRGDAEWSRYIVWQQGAAVKSFWTLKSGETEDKNLSMALGAAAGVSESSSVLVPSLLLPEAVRGGIWKILATAKLAGEEQVEKSAAYKLEVQDARGQFTLWVDKSRLVILKFYRKHKFDPATVPGSKSMAAFETESTITFSPAINENVPTARLEFMALFAK